MRRRMILTSLTIALAVITTVPRTPAEACIHGDSEFATDGGTITTDTQEAILVHSEGREELILRADYRIRGKELPKTVAWVLTVPAEPNHYRTVEVDVFTQTMQWAQELTYIPPPPARGVKKNRPGEMSVDDDVEVSQKVEVGPYAIQPIRGRGANAAKGVNEWFKKNGFSEVAPEHLAYFTENNFTFLCVKITPAKSAIKGQASGELEPLAILFETAKPYYPLKFFAFQGDFNLKLACITRQEIDPEMSRSILQKLMFKEGLRKTNVTTKALPEKLVKVLQDGHEKLKKTDGEWKVNYFHFSRFNTDKQILKWNEDVFFALK